MTLKPMKRKDITRVGLAILLLLFPLSKTEAQHSSPYITIKNNLLYDILLIPNLGADIYVGKNNFQNEELSFKFASGNDWWFHAKGQPGSHVIVKTNGKELPDSVYEEAAALAAYYSKGRQAPKVEIDYTLKKNLRKPNGSKPGFVVYYTNYSMMAEPNIRNLQEIQD